MDNTIKKERTGKRPRKLSQAKMESLRGGGGSGGGGGGGKGGGGMRGGGSKPKKDSHPHHDFFIGVYS